MIENIPEVIVVGDIELFFAGVAVAVGAPKFARKLLVSKYGKKVMNKVKGK